MPRGRKKHLNIATLLMPTAGLEPGPPAQQASALSIAPLPLGYTNKSWQVDDLSAGELSLNDFSFSKSQQTGKVTLNRISMSRKSLEIWILGSDETTSKETKSLSGGKYEKGVSPSTKMVFSLPWRQPWDS